MSNDEIIENIRRATAIAMMADTNVELTVEQAALLINEHDRLKKSYQELELHHRIAHHNGNMATAKAGGKTYDPDQDFEDLVKHL